MKIFILMCVSIAVCSCGKLPKATQDPNSIFANDPDLQIPDEDEDKPASTFTGNVMQAKITNLENKNHGKGKFRYTFETQNGISISQVGKLKDPKTFVVSGSYSYTGADGRRYRVRYTADEFGYHPKTELEEIEGPELVVAQALPRLPVSTLQGPASNSRFGNGAGNGNNGVGGLDARFGGFNGNNGFNSAGRAGKSLFNNNGNGNLFNNGNGNGNGKSLFGNGNGNGNDGGERGYLPPVASPAAAPQSREYLPPKGFVPPKQDY